MNKNLMAVILFPVFVNDCITDPFESERDVDIITDNSSYIFADEIKIKVSFKNNLLRDIRIVNTGCFVPFFILEKKIDNNWEQVYTPTCNALYVEPINVGSGESFTAEINIQTSDIQNENPFGEYRLYFDLMEKGNNKMLQDKYLYSNVFRITEVI